MATSPRSIRWPGARPRRSWPWAACCSWASGWRAPAGLADPRGAWLAERGFGASELAQVTCPIGLPGIAGKEPAVIAAGVAAQLLQRRDAGPA